jgi:uncharacterized membrane protein YccF (DUF307 family)
MVGVSMMVMGQSAVEINNQSIEPYMNRIVERERLRNKGLQVKEKWKELGSLFIAIFVFCVAPRKFKVDVVFLVCRCRDIQFSGGMDVL